MRLIIKAKHKEVATIADCSEIYVCSVLKGRRDDLRNINNIERELTEGYKAVFEKVKEMYQYEKTQDSEN